MPGTDKSATRATMLAGGEMTLGMPDDPEQYFDLIAPTFRAADVVVGHLEVPHTLRPEPAWENMLPAPDPDKLRGLTSAEFTLVSMAGNPVYSYGPPGIADTTAWLRENGIRYVGAGMDINEARRPVVVERNGTRFGFLSYDCIGYKSNAATRTKPGCAFVDIITHYEPSRFPGGTPQIYTWAEPWSLEAMREDIRALRQECDVLSVALHMGLGREEIVLADYEAQVSYAAIDAGADLILGYHCHILKGVEFYRGKPIFHCLGNLVTVFPWESHRTFLREPETTISKSRIRGRAGSGRSLIDPEYPNYPFAPESRNAIVVKVEAEAGAVSRLSFLPCLINKKGQPEVVGHDEQGQQVVDYMEKITRGAGLNGRFEWDGDEVLVLEA